jgi:hypothetical protein
MNTIIPLAEGDMYVLFKEFEDVFLFEKDTNKELWRISLYGDATGGLIGLVNDWVVVGGEKLIIWSEGKLETIEDSELTWIFDLRQIGDDEIQILTDPWTSNSAIWSFDIISKRKVKIRNFNDYVDKPYSDNVIW